MCIFLSFFYFFLWCPVPAVWVWNLGSSRRPSTSSSCRRSWTASCHWPVSLWGMQRCVTLSLKTRAWMYIEVLCCLTSKCVFVRLSVWVSLQETDGFSWLDVENSHSADGAGSVTSWTHWSGCWLVYWSSFSVNGGVVAFLTCLPVRPSPVLSSIHYEHIQTSEDAAVSLLCVQLWTQVCTSSR